ADRRVLLPRVSLDRAYNLRNQDGSGFFAATTNGGTPWTWADLFADLTADVGAITLPYTPDGTPENRNFYGKSAWDAVNAVLADLACAARWDPATDLLDA